LYDFILWLDFLQENPFLMMLWSFCLQDYEKARDAFADALKLDPGNTEIENALR
jgi:hypothetical protein